MDLVLIIARFIHYTSLMLVFGGLFYARVLAGGALGHLVYRRIDVGCRLFAWAAVLSGVLWLMLVTASMGDGIADAISADMLATVAFDTSFGRAWCGHLGISCVLLGCLVADRRRATKRPSWSTIAMSIASVLSLAPTSHAMMPEGIELLASIASQALHLVSGGYWVGSLIPVLITIRAMENGFRDEAIGALRRFSRLGHLAVACVMASGMANLWFISGHRLTSLANPYAALVITKVLIVGGMVVLAVLNRYWLVPRMRQDQTALPCMQTFTIGILALGLAAIGLVSLFGLLSPT